MRRAALLGAAVRAGALCACTGALACVVDPPQVPVVSAAVEPAGARLDADFRLVEAVGQGILLPLPDADGWRRDPREAMTWVASHTATDSRLLVRTFRAERIARAQDCEQQMRLWRRDLPALAAAGRESRRVRLEGGYAGELVTAAEVRGASHVVTGHALVFASDGRECLCLAFSTSAEGSGAASIVGARLGNITRGAFERAHRLGIEANVRPPER